MWGLGALIIGIPLYFIMKNANKNDVNDKSHTVAQNII